MFGQNFKIPTKTTQNKISFVQMHEPLRVQINTTMPVPAMKKETDLDTSLLRKGTLHPHNPHMLAETPSQTRARKERERKHKENLKVFRTKMNEVVKNINERELFARMCCENPKDYNR